MTELRQVIANLKTIDSYLDLFLLQKGNEFNSILKENSELKEENKKLKQEIDKLKTSK